MLGNTLYWLGELIPARKHLERGLALYSAVQSQRPSVWIDERLGGLAYEALVLWLLGYPDQARHKIQVALTSALELSHPFSSAHTFGLAAMVHQLCQEVQATQVQLEELLSLSTQHRFPLWSAWGTLYRGWTLTKRGGIREGIIQQREGLAAYRAIGSEAFAPYFLALQAEALGDVEKPNEGLVSVCEAIAAADRTGERFYEAELYRLQGELTLQVRDQAEETGTQEAERCFLKAVEVARAQEAKSLELRASTSLARLWQQQRKQLQAYALLAQIYNWFTEGFDTADLKDAKALLDELSN
jgi:predicted ATPase